MAAIRGYPKTRFQLIDQSQIPTIPVEQVYENIAIVMVAYTSDKGSEGWEMIRGLDNFTRAKGGISFEKHGQTQLTIAEILRSGGIIFGKRMVSSDATLANATIRARVVQVDGVSYVYTYAVSAPNVGNLSAAAEAGYANFDSTNEETMDFPLFTITATGRGATSLMFRLNPEYSGSRRSNVLRYTCEVYENNEKIDNVVGSLHPDYVVDNISQNLQNKINANSDQIRCKLHIDAVYAFARCLLKTATINGESTTIEELMNHDLIFGVDKLGGAMLGGVVGAAVDADNSSDEWNANKPSDIADYVYDVSSPNGILLTNGSYGKMGTAPVKNTDEYTQLLLGAWGKNTDSEQYDPVIYDLDAFKPDAVFGCNYPVAVNNAIIDVADFRGDIVFFADLGIDKFTLTDILDAADYLNKSRFCAVYHNSFNVIDRFTKKEITVTMPYLLASRFVKHIDGGVARPFAGIANELTFPEIISGTINFLPYITPNDDQKQKLANACVNYLNYYDGLAVMETTYVNYEDYTRLSFLHNILAIQEVIKAIRSRCPRVRYTFLDGDDLERYIEDARQVIRNYTTNFEDIDIEYMADETYEANNIFYATIEVNFHEFIQEEFFKVIAIG